MGKAPPHFHERSPLRITLRGMRYRSSYGTRKTKRIWIIVDATEQPTIATLRNSYLLQRTLKTAPLQQHYRTRTTDRDLGLANHRRRISALLAGLTLLEEYETNSATKRQDNNNHNHQRLLNSTRVFLWNLARHRRTHRGFCASGCKACGGIQDIRCFAGLKLKDALSRNDIMHANTMRGVMRRLH